MWFGINFEFDDLNNNSTNNCDKRWATSDHKKYWLSHCEYHSVLISLVHQHISFSNDIQNEKAYNYYHCAQHASVGATSKFEFCHLCFQVFSYLHKRMVIVIGVFFLWIRSLYHVEHRWKCREVNHFTIVLLIHMMKNYHQVDHRRSKRNFIRSETIRMKHLNFAPFILNCSAICLGNKSDSFLQRRQVKLSWSRSHGCRKFQLFSI